MRPGGHLHLSRVWSQSTFRCRGLPDCWVVCVRRCPSRGEKTYHVSERCPTCDGPLAHLRRDTARYESGHANGQIVTWAGCSTCLSRFVPQAGPCPGCGGRECPGCRLVLLVGETTCLRCGAGTTTKRPACQAPVAPGAPERAACGHPLCPDCGTAVDETDTLCPGCGAVLALVCPSCGCDVAPEDIMCPQCGTSFEAAISLS